jgi:hypothetical protein
MGTKSGRPRLDRLVDGEEAKGCDIFWASVFDSEGDGLGMI